MFAVGFCIVLLLPLFSFLLISIFGTLVGTYGSMIISCFNVLCALLFCVFFLTHASFSFSAFVDVWQWVSVAGFDVAFTLRYDSLTAIMFLVVLVVSACVHFYSCVYMYTDPFLARFLSYLSLFTFFMLLLVSAGNFLVLFLGLEGFGLCSYLLIGFWYTRAQACKAATKAFLINKVGDLFLLAGICFIFLNFHTLDFASLFVLAPFFPLNVLEICSFFLFIGAIWKSAQIGLHTWLPDSM